MTKRAPLKDQSLAILRERAIPVSAVLDVGVCHGTPELMQGWRDVPHILFEPVAEFAAPITKHYRNLRHELHQVAVSDTEGTVSLQTSAVLPGMAVSHSVMVDGATTTAPNMREVPKITLDGFLVGRPDLQGPFLLKIDIDGQEMRVLKGAAKTLERCSIVIVECQRNELPQRILAVQQAGFQLFDLMEPCYYDKMFWQCDAVFVRNDLVERAFKPLKGKVEPGMYEAFRDP